MHRHPITIYDMLPHGGSDAPIPPPRPPPPSSPPQEPARPQGDEEEDSDDEEFFTNLPMDAESEEDTAEQRAILASFETRRRD
jgi:hypothetical protein